MSAAPTRRAALGRIFLAVVFAVLLPAVVLGLARAAGVFLLAYAYELPSAGARLAELLAFCFAVSLCFFALARVLPGWKGRLAVVAAGAAILAIGWLRTLPPPDGATFHDFVTLSPSRVAVDANPWRPRIGYRVNAYGLRGAEWSESPAPGRTRIALVGDSYAFGIGVRDEATIDRLLAESLARCGRTDVEVVNLGIPGNNLASHVRMAELAADRLGAEVVVAGLTLYNDLAEWDAQDELAGAARPSGFSLAAFLLGNEAARLAATRLLVEHAEPHLGPDGTFVPPEAQQRVLRRGLARLDALASRPGGPAVVLLPFAHVEALRRTFRPPPPLRIADASPLSDAYYLPRDRHPNERGTRAFADAVLAALRAPPAIVERCPPDGAASR